MIKKIYFSNKLLKDSMSISYKLENNTIYLSLKKNKNITVPKIEFHIEFEKPIISWRNFDYKWVDTKKERSANDHSPKILVLSDGNHVISSKNIGLWHYEPKSKNEIKWVLKHQLLTPLFKYNKNGGRDFINEFTIENFEFKLLFTKDSVPEFSRSKIPFSPIICFTDHCDFDNNDNLKKQLAFFKSHNIKITKGFFLNSFSKRKDNSSYERDKQIISEFIKNDNELAYHSLTQSIRNEDEAMAEFFNFTPPFSNINTYIDHGYQPYNYTLIDNKKDTLEKWTKNLFDKSIKNLWTYLDSGTSGLSIINQINPEHFTPKRILSLKKPLKEKFKFFFRTYLFFSGNEKLLLNYRNIASLIKQLLYNKKVFNIFPLFVYIIKVFFPIVKGLLFSKKDTFKYAKYSPLIFKNKIGKIEFNMFQTVEVTNFEDTFSKINLDILQNENGVIICHNYFSSPLPHQKGKLFQNGSVSKINQENFNYLGNLITQQKIWNPTVSELIEQYNKNLQLCYSFNENKKIIIENINPEIHTRYIKYD